MQPLQSAKTLNRLFNDEGHALTIDLNLLKVFDAIMTDCSLTLAAKRLGKTQSAVSHALTRLRGHTGDRLFERTGNGVRPTPRALDMEKEVRRGLAIIQGALQQGGQFDPARQERNFLLDLPVGLDWIIGPQLAIKISGMPGLSFRINTARAANILSELRFRESWLALDYQPMTVEGFKSEVLYEDSISVVARLGHPAFGEPLTPGTLSKLDQVGIGWSTLSHPAQSPVDERLLAAGLPRRVKLWVGTLASMMVTAERTDLIAYSTSRVAREFAKTHRLLVQPLPVQVPCIPLIMVWHEGFDQDPGHQWLREAVREICRSM